MAVRTMKGPEALFRLKVVSERYKGNPDYTGYGSVEPPYLGTGEAYTEYYGPYTRRHAAASMQGIVGCGAWVISAVIETCQPEWTTA